MDRWQAMRVFVKVAETKGFAEAARHLHMSPPAVTRAVAALEETIGARLLVRTTRSVTLTDAGARFFEDCSRILADLAEAEASAAGSFATPTGALTITAPVMFVHRSASAPCSSTAWSISSKRAWTWPCGSATCPIPASAP
jgi:DNA-binding transcriptional LysR family regulator